MQGSEVSQVEFKKHSPDQLNAFNEQILVQTQMIEAMAASSTDEELCAIASQFIPELLSVQLCVFYKKHDHSLATRAKYNSTSSEQGATDSFLLASQHLSEMAIERRGTLIFNELSSSALAQESKLLLSGLTAMLATPIVANNHLAGALVIGRTSGIPFDSLDESLIHQVVTILGLRIERNHLLKEKDDHLVEVEQANSELNVTIHNLHERETELKHLLDTNQELLSITSHDLKNPLGGILGLCDIIIEDSAQLSGHTLGEVLENTHLIKREAEHMMSIIKSVLDKHRNEVKQTFILQESNVAQLIQDVIQWNQSQADSKNIDIHFYYGTHVRFNVDPPSLQRAVDNYLSNAIKYSPHYSKVWIQLDAHALDGSYWRISVKDEGPGLNADDKKRVFRKMQRLSAQPTAGEHSTGLGLFIVKQIVEHHGGTVGVDSVSGQGASFWMLFPQHDKFLDKLREESAIQS